MCRWHDGGGKFYALAQGSSGPGLLCLEYSCSYGLGHILALYYLWEPLLWMCRVPLPSRLPVQYCSKQTLASSSTSPGIVLAWKPFQDLPAVFVSLYSNFLAISGLRYARYQSARST